MIYNELEPSDPPPDSEVRACHDCAHLIAHVTWWCGDDDAFAEHRTRLPIAVGCKFWSPAPVVPQ